MRSGSPPAASAAASSASTTSEGELAAALAAGGDPGRMVVHGNAKTDADLEAAVAAGCGLVILDGPDEAARVALAAARHGRRQPVALRLTPGIDAGAHAKIRTGGTDSKFGFTPEAAELAIAAVRDEPRFWLRGLHVHLGSQVVDGGELESAVGWLAGYCERVGLDPELLDLGGGLGIAYEDETPPDPARHAEALSRAVDGAFPRATLVSSPGDGRRPRRDHPVHGAGDEDRGRRQATSRSTAGCPTTRARSCTTRATRSPRRGGWTTPRSRRSTSRGHCESGDVLVRGVSLPSMWRGDLVGVAATGAYSQSMASTYNLVPRAAAVIVEAGRSSS